MIPPVVGSECTELNRMTRLKENLLDKILCQFDAALLSVFADTLRTECVWWIHPDASSRQDAHKRKKRMIWISKGTYNRETVLLVRKVTPFKAEWSLRCVPICCVWIFLTHARQCACEILLFVETLRNYVSDWRFALSETTILNLST